MISCYICITIIHLLYCYVQFSICYLLVLVSADLFDHDLLNHEGHFSHTSNHVGYSTVPHDSEEITATKAVHFVAHADAKARLVCGHGAQNNEPIDTPEVQIAKFQHQIAHGEAKQRLENSALARPLDTFQMQVAKQEHVAKYADEKLRNSHAASPVDTLEGQQAKVEHFHARSQAQVQQTFGNDQNRQDPGFGHSHVHAGIVTPIIYKHHHGW